MTRSLSVAGRQLSHGPGLPHTSGHEAIGSKGHRDRNGCFVVVASRRRVRPTERIGPVIEGTSRDSDFAVPRPKSQAIGADGGEGVVGGRGVERGSTTGRLPAGLVGDIVVVKSTAT